MGGKVLGDAKGIGRFQALIRHRSAGERCWDLKRSGSLIMPEFPSNGGLIPVIRPKFPFNSGREIGL